MRAVLLAGPLLLTPGAALPIILGAAVLTRILRGGSRRLRNALFDARLELEHFRAYPFRRRGWLPTMTRREWATLLASDAYWKDRWGYLREVIRIISREPVKSVLELGPYKGPIVKTADVMDLVPYYGRTPYKWDATQTPWPIRDQQYDLFVALQVWEHLGDRQAAAFAEVKRTSRMAVLSFPYRWHCPGDCHHGIDEARIAEWTLHTRPAVTQLVGSRMIQFFKF